MKKDSDSPYIHFIDEKSWAINDHIYRSDELTPLYIDRYNGIRTDPHMDFHNYWELLAVFKGKGRIKGIKQTFEIGKYCICLVPPTIKHAELSDEKIDTIWIGLEGSLLDRFDSTEIHLVTSKDLARDIEQLWLKRIKSFGLIGPELDGLTQALLGLFLKLLSTKENYSHESTIKDILLYINQNYAINLNIAFLSEKYGYSESYFYRIFKRHVGLSPVEYITNVRIKNALMLMKNSSLSIKRISQMVGYKDSLYFSRLFKKKMGQSPKNLLSLGMYKHS